MLIEYCLKRGVNENMATLVFHSLPSLSIDVAHKELLIEALIFFCELLYFQALEVFTF
jgi:hypothetical protein